MPCGSRFIVGNNSTARSALVSDHAAAVGTFDIDDFATLDRGRLEEVHIDAERNFQFAVLMLAITNFREHEFMLAQRAVDALRLITIAL